MLPLPEPVKGGSLDELRQFLNVASDDDFKLMIAWLLFSLRPNGPYPPLIIQGEQGSAKSTTSRILRRLVDPHTTELRSGPKNTQDLMITAINSWLIALDNLSGLRHELSDGLCCLATGGGFAARALYTNREESHFSAMRPILVNGIDDLAERPDLLSRAILLHLPSIPEENRKEESEFWGQFEAAQGMIFGVLLDAYAKALEILPAVQVDRRPRMADFARWGEAAGRGLGWGEGAFLGAYWTNIEGVTESAAEASPVAMAILVLMANLNTVWKGTTAELLAALTEIVGEKQARAPWWPQNAKKLSNQLVRLAPVLRNLGIQYDRLKERTRKGSLLILSKVAKPQPPSSADRTVTTVTTVIPTPVGPEYKGVSSNGDCDGTCDGAAGYDRTVTAPSLGPDDLKLLKQNDLRNKGDGGDGGDGTGAPLIGEDNESWPSRNERDSTDVSGGWPPLKNPPSASAKSPGRTRGEL
jgi:hypothetical protein